MCVQRTAKRHNLSSFQKSADAPSPRSNTTPSWPWNEHRPFQRWWTRQAFCLFGLSQIQWDQCQQLFLNQIDIIIRVLLSFFVSLFFLVVKASCSSFLHAWVHLFPFPVTFLRSIQCTRRYHQELHAVFELCLKLTISRCVERTTGQIHRGQRTQPPIETLRLPGAHSTLSASQFLREFKLCWEMCSYASIQLTGIQCTYLPKTTMYGTLSLRCQMYCKVPACAQIHIFHQHGVFCACATSYAGLLKCHNCLWRDSAFWSRRSSGLLPTKPRLFFWGGFNFRAYFFSPL